MDNEIRFDPLLKEWVIVATNVAKRPLILNTTKDNKKSEFCPFCPDAPEGTGNWIVKWVPNRFPSLRSDLGHSFNEETIEHNFFRVRPGKGRCEVILYSQNHNSSFADLSIDHIVELIKLWINRFNSTINEDQELKYTYIFENRGTAIGVSLSHPHGQLYSFPFIPQKIQRIIDSAKEFFENNNECIFCRIIKLEKQETSRIVEENDNFIAFIPYYAKWPFEIHIYPKKHYSSISNILETEFKSFATILKKVVLRLDGLYGFVMPYVMAHMNPPIHSGNMDFYHYHIEIYPPYRDKDKLKFLAGVELGTNVIINPANPADSAKKLRNVIIPNL